MPGTDRQQEGAASRWLERWRQADRSPRVAAWACLPLFVLVATRVFGLVDLYHLHAFEPDAETSIRHAIGYLHLMRWGSPALLPPIGDYPPMFDAAFILYAAAAGLVAGIHALFPASLDLPTFESEVIFAMRAVNAASLALSVVPLFLALRVTGRRNAAAFLLAPLLALGPPVLALDLLRVDHVVILALCSVVYLSLAVAERPRGAGWYILLGLATAFLANTKITLPALAVIPLLALGWARATGRCGWRHCLLFAGAAAVAAALLAWRFILLGPGLPAVLGAKLADHRLWKHYYPLTPYAFYNWGYLLPYGRLLRLLGIVAAGLAALGVVRRRRGAPFVAVAGLVILSLLLLPMIKYPRGGYLLIPFYLLALAAGLATASDWLAARGPHLALASGLLVLPVIVEAAPRLADNYRHARRLARERAESVRVTRILPRAWFVRHVPSGTRVGIHRWRQVKGPPIWDLGYTWVDHWLDPPILAPERMRHYAPPTWASLAATCDLLLLDSDSRRELTWAVDSFATPENRRAWAAFLSELDARAVRVDFTARHANHGVCAVSVHLIHPAVLRQPGRALRQDAPSGITVQRPAAHAGPVSPGRFAWLGDCDATRLPSLVHAQLGVLRVDGPASDEGISLWSADLGGALWTSRERFPLLLRAADQAWVRYHCGTRAPRVFYNLNTRREELFP